MSDARQASKPKGRAKTATVLGVAGALSLAGGASGAASGPAGDTGTKNTSGEEEISDVSLATFYVFDNESAEAPRPELKTCQKLRQRLQSLLGLQRLRSSLRRLRRLRRRDLRKRWRGRRRGASRRFCEAAGVVAEVVTKTMIFTRQIDSNVMPNT